jgi:hypothetical protein
MKICPDCQHEVHEPGKCLEPVEVPVCCNCPEVNLYGELICCNDPVLEMLACYCGMEDRIRLAYEED